MLDRHIEILEYAGHLSDKSSFAAHQVLVHRNNREVLASRDACDDLSVFQLCRLCSDYRARIFRSVSVSDVDRDIRDSRRIDRILMQDRCSHIRKLSEFFVRNCAYRFRVFDDPWVCHKEARYVRPVLIHVCTYRSRYDRTCDVRAAS